MGLDHINRPLPSRKVRKPEEKRKRREPGPGKGKPDANKMPSEHKPRGDDHQVDELA
jgi:hypothetical protein